MCKEEGEREVEMGKGVSGFLADWFLADWQGWREFPIFRPIFRPH